MLREREEDYCAMDTLIRTPFAIYETALWTIKEILKSAVHNHVMSINLYLSSNISPTLYLFCFLLMIQYSLLPVSVSTILTL